MQADELTVLAEDKYLREYKPYFVELRQKYAEIIRTLEQNQGGLVEFSRSYNTYGVHRVGDKFVYREWAPGALAVYLFGEFNAWNRKEYAAKKDPYGTWELVLTGKVIPQFSKLKAHVQLANGSWQDRIPAWIPYTIQNEDASYDGIFLQDDYKFRFPNPTWPNDQLKIYQCHIGMSGIQPKVHSYTYFKDNIIDRVVYQGYNAIQLMGIMQHPYYGSFGYHVSNFFAVSSRCGTPRDFKQMVDYAHSKGLKVLIDLVHAHAATNTNQGINMWDGTDYQYFHSLPKGYHSVWDSRIFDYSKYEVLRFLLSNIRFWMEEYRVDGYRFDGVTSMIYQHHGINFGFTGNYKEYFNENLEKDALVYLMLANRIIKSINPFSVSIAEDVSGFPCLCRTFVDGGIGFDFRLCMAIPDMWIKLLKEVKDQDWDIEEIAYQLTNRREKQKSIAYAESHDQALVGDKTLSMWLFDKDIYENMSVLSVQTVHVFRAMALHKMIRLLTISLGGEGYLNFMGNQFGHPQWIDFPRQGNQWSYHYCRRRWDLADDPCLRYNLLLKFDHDMIHLQISSKFLAFPNDPISIKNNTDKIIIFERAGLVFVFNFHCSKSYEDYRVPASSKKDKKVALCTDDKKYGGHQRLDANLNYVPEYVEGKDNKYEFRTYIPSRCAIVFRDKQEE